MTLDSQAEVPLLFLIWSYNKWEKVTIYFSEALKSGMYQVSPVKAGSSKSPSCTGVNFKQMGWISCHRPAQLDHCSSCNSLRNMQMWIAFSRRWLPLQMLLWSCYSLFPNSGFPLPPRPCWSAPTYKLVPGDIMQGPLLASPFLPDLWQFSLIDQGPNFARRFLNYFICFSQTK